MRYHLIIHLTIYFTILLVLPLYHFTISLFTSHHFTSLHITTLPVLPFYHVTCFTTILARQNAALVEGRPLSNTLHNRIREALSIKNIHARILLAEMLGTFILVVSVLTINVHAYVVVTDV